MGSDYSSSEMMAARAAKELRDGDIIFVGIGLPNVVCNLARETHAPSLELVYESGAVGARPERLPVSIGDPALVTGALSIVSQAEIFNNYLQGGLIQLGFLGGAQVDKYGNLNTTVVGDYANPKVRLPGSGGACEIAVHSKRLLIVMRMSHRSFVEECDFVTSPGQYFKGRSRQDLALPGAGPEKIITDKCVMTFSKEKGEFCVSEIYPGVTREEVQSNCAWPIKFLDSVSETAVPSVSELKLLREKLDPQKLYL